MHSIYFLLLAANNSEPMNVHYDIEVIGLSDILEYEQILRIELILNIHWEVVNSHYCKKISSRKG